MNPDNHPPDVLFNNGFEYTYYYDFEIAQRVPDMLRCFDLIWFVLIVLGIIMVCDPKKHEDSQDNIQEEDIE